MKALEILKKVDMLADCSLVLDCTIKEHGEAIEELEFEMEMYKQCQHQLGLCEKALEEAEQELSDCKEKFGAELEAIADNSRMYRELQIELKDCKEAYEILFKQYMKHIVDKAINDKE